MTHDELHAAIMNLPCKEKARHSRQDGLRAEYTYGHRDARHAAAELVLAALPAAVVGWQPIETAPKDGTRILAAPHAAVGSPGWFIAHWGSGHFGGLGGMPGKFREGWMDGPFYAGPQPTHWQPLPAPPAAAPVEQESGECNAMDGI